MRKAALTIAYLLFGLNPVGCRQIPFTKQQAMGVMSSSVDRRAEWTYSNAAMMVHFLLSDSGKTRDLGP